MSSMLEQAIIDADQLKEAAKKTAEETVVEKYQNEIKEAIEKILEQDELGEEAEMTTTPEGSLEFVEDLPSSQVTEEEEVVEINLDKLEEMMQEELENGGLNASEMASREDIAEELTEDEEVELEESDLLELTEDEIELDEDAIASVIAEMLGEDATKDVAVAEKDVKKATDAFESAEEELEEELSPKQSKTMDTDKDGDIDKKDLATLRKVKESRELKKKNKTLLKEQQTLGNKVQLLETKLDKYGTIVIKLKNKLDESSLTNTKLLYQNRILNSVSLNERQRNKIVEAISNANSAGEAKLIFETLQSAVGISKRKRKIPESLNEVVSRSSSAFIPRKEAQSKVDTFSERMKALAGLK